MSRISSQGTVIMISDSDTPTPIAIGGATKAKPCVLTITAGPGVPVVGDIVVPRNTGWNSIEGMPFKVIDVGETSVTLEDSDTSGEVADIADEAEFVVPVFLELCRSTFTANSPAGATIDVTTLCDIAHRIVPGLPAVGTWNAAGFYVCDDVALELARDYYRSGAKAVIDVRLPDGCGWTFMAIVNSFDVTLGINAAVANNIGGQIDGQIHFYKTPVAGFVTTARRQPQAVAPAQAASDAAEV